MAVVVLDRLTKVFERGHAPAADAVSLGVEHGEFMVLLGPSGCGKTTTLRMIAGLESISSGTLSIDGEVVNDVPAKNRDIAMVFQSYALYPHMTVRKNLAFGLKRRAVDRAEIEQRVASVADTLGLSELLGRKPHALSGGQRQRVALGRAIVRNPKVFLFDEPLSNLDASLRVSTRGEIAALHRRLGATMIYVTHDQVEAMTMGHRICIMNSGKVVQVGAPLDVYRNPENTFVAGFLGNPPMNLVEAVVSDEPDGRTLRFGDTAVRLHPARSPPLRAGTPVVFGIRPEHVADVPHPGADDAAIEAETFRIESLGAETIVFAQLPGIEKQLVARVGGAARFTVGERQPLYLDLTEAHLSIPTGRSCEPEI